MCNPQYSLHRSNLQHAAWHTCLERTPCALCPSRRSWIQSKHAAEDRDVPSMSDSATRNVWPALCSAYTCMQTHSP